MSSSSLLTVTKKYRQSLSVRAVLETIQAHVSGDVLGDDDAGG